MESELMTESSELGVRVGGVAMVWWSCEFLFGGLGLAQDRDENFYFFTCFSSSHFG